LNNYRFFSGFIDEYNRNNRIFTLESRAHNYYRRIHDNGGSYRRYYYGATAITYLNYVYFAGAMSYGGTGINDGTHPIIGYASYDLSLQNSWYMNNNGDNNMRQFMFERLHTGHGQNDNLITGFAPQRDYNWNIRYGQRWLILVGHDTTTHGWRSNVGAWDWSTWTYNDYRDGLKIVDDTCPGCTIYESNQDKMYILVRRWENNHSNMWAKKQTNGYSRYSFMMGMRYLDRIYDYHNRLDYQS
jgi:hypothetical protein